MAQGLREERAAITAGLTLPWSHGPVEGHGNRLTLLKRQGYGRAGFALLRHRVLLPTVGGPGGQAPPTVTAGACGPARTAGDGRRSPPESSLGAGPAGLPPMAHHVCTARLSSRMPLTGYGAPRLTSAPAGHLALRGKHLREFLPAWGALQSIHQKRGRARRSWRGLMRGPPASPLFASWPWPRYNWMLVGSS